jgi:hypothetical protein
MADYGPELSNKLQRYLELKQSFEQRRTQEELHRVGDLEVGGIEDVFIFQAGFGDLDEFWTAVDAASGGSGLD